MSDTPTATRVESHLIRPGHPFYKWAMAECGKAAALYNRVNFIYRQAYTGHLEQIPEYADLVRQGRFVYGFDIISRMRKLREPHFFAMAKRAGAGQTVMQVDAAWRTWLRSMRAYGQYPECFRGRPRMPGYKPAREKGGLHVVVYAANDARLQADGRILICRGLYLPLRTRVQRLRQVRLVPRAGALCIEVLYDKSLPVRQVGGAAVGVDVGVNNLAAITSDDGGLCHLVNGRPLKSMAHYYRRAKTAAVAELARAGLRSSARLKRLHTKYMCKVKDYLHKASRRVAELVARHGAGLCCIGQLPPGQREAPQGMFIRMLRYKLEELGVRVAMVSERHTSSCSYLDGEPLSEGSSRQGQRICRGLFVSGGGKAINADTNASLNILRRAWSGKLTAHSAVLTPTRLDINLKHPSPT